VPDLSIEQADRVRELAGDLQAMKMMAASPQFGLFLAGVDGRSRRIAERVLRDSAELTNNEVRELLGAAAELRSVTRIVDRLVSEIERDIERVKGPRDL